MSVVARNVPKLLGPDDPEAVGLRNAEGDSPFLLICDHAGNRIPSALGTLGLGPEDLTRHIAYDIGILGVSELLADRLRAPLVFQRYSRLVVECNRLYASEELIAQTSDGTPIPGNRGLAPEAAAARIAEIAEPYHGEISRRLGRREAQGLATVLVSMHSFTPSLRSGSAHRPWEVALCYGADDRFTRHVLDALEAEGDLVIGRNEPYAVDFDKDYSIPIHGEARGCPYAEFELRQDLIETPDQQQAWGERLARTLRTALANSAFLYGTRPTMRSEG